MKDLFEYRIDCTIEGCLREIEYIEKTEKVNRYYNKRCQFLMGKIEALEYAKTLRLYCR